jgi:peptidoglycan/LPS O-acetylase OafA/YrhL
MLFVVATGFGPQTITPVKVLANIFVVPLNYDMLLDATMIQGLAIFPPAWSLGAELQVYAVLPFILRSVRAKWIVGVASLGLFSVAAAGFIDGVPWGYRLPFGVMFIFLTGAALWRVRSGRTDSFDRLFPKIAWTWVAVMALCLSALYRLQPTPAAVSAGYLLGVPMLQFSQGIRLPFDSLMGRLSYGLFLIHIPAAWMLYYFAGISSLRPLGLLANFALSLTISAIGVLTVEKATWPLRKRLSEPSEGVPLNVGAAIQS